MIYMAMERATKMMVALSLCTWLSGASAASPRGEVVATSGNGSGSTPCVVCHGATGQGQPAAGFPRLAGMNAAYVSKQLSPEGVNLWATWCGPCRRERPMLMAAQVANSDIHFVFADEGEDVGLVTKYLAASGFTTANVVLDAKSDLARASDAQGWPTPLFLNDAGQSVASDTGELTATTLSKRLAALRTGKAE